jgi:hypothetical protein
MNAGPTRRRAYLSLGAWFLYPGGSDGQVVLFRKAAHDRPVSYDPTRPIMATFSRQKLPMLTPLVPIRQYCGPRKVYWGHPAGRTDTMTGAIEGALTEGTVVTIGMLP